MNAHSSLWLAIPLALMLPIGCNNAAGTGQASEAVAAAPAAVDTNIAAPTQAATQTRSHKKHHARGPAAMLFRAAKSLDVDADQRATIDNLTTNLRADRASMRAPMEALHAALVAGVKAGNVDLAALAPLQAAVKAAHQAHAAREASALDGLWATLQPAQRAALVATVRERQAERAERWAEHRAEGEGQAAWAAKRVERLTETLALTDAQQVAVANMTVKQEQPTAQRTTWRAAMKARNEALLTAFTGDSFEAKNLELAPIRGANEGMAHGHAAFLAQLVPVLDASQRTALAASMESKRSARD
jgi:hypothetical protein